MNYIFHIILIALLTLITQVGGAIYLIAVIVYKLFSVKKKKFKLAIILGIYFATSFAIIPHIAKQNNRVPMPFFQASKKHIGPHTLFTVFANRHYVRPEMKQLLLNAATSVNKKYPGTKVEYLDGSFPLFKKWRMRPHLKHDDGKKLDVGFIRKKNSGKYSNRYFSFFGYGFCEKPKVNEIDIPSKCEKQGKFQYNIIEKVVPDQKWRKLEFPVEENKYLISQLLKQNNCRYIFIEPHLRDRLGFTNHNKVRFHGCWAVRHDDHMHVQLK